MILIEYKVENQHHSAFLHAIDYLSNERRRDGTYGWGVTEDSADPEKMVEWFMVESWAEHLCQHGETCCQSLPDDQPAWCRMTTNGVWWRLRPPRRNKL
ncbi:MFS transporter [Ensifer sp. SL37]|nr:MFS transporter [Ensifer sp. SL37]MCY1745281.1 MFS transporter [Ensifer sp. SL37]